MNVDKFGRYTYTGMTIDKFGRHQSRERLRGPKGEGFKLTEDGDYNIENKRLVNVADPTLETDGVNLKTINSQLSSCMKVNNDDMFDAQNRRVCNVADPFNSNDVLTKGHFDSNTPFKLNASLSYSFHQYRIQDVAEPEEDGDAVNLKYVKRETVKKTDGNWDVGNLRISNLAKPQDIDDAVSKRYLKTVLSELGYAVYKSINKGRADTLPAEEWKSKVMDSTWEELFNGEYSSKSDQL